MATSATVFYATEPTIVRLSEVRSSSAHGPRFPIKTRIKLNNGKVAIYARAGGAINPSTSVLALAANGTASAGSSAGTAGPWVSMNDTTTSAGDYFWLRSSADEAYP